MVCPVCKHKSRQLVLAVHVDDIAAAGCHTDLLWLQDMFENKVEVTVEGPIGRRNCNADEPVMFLKKRRYFTEKGIVVKPHDGLLVLALAALYGCP